MSVTATGHTTTAGTKCDLTASSCVCSSAAVCSMCAVWQLSTSSDMLDSLHRGAGWLGCPGCQGWAAGCGGSGSLGRPVCVPENGVLVPRRGVFRVLSTLLVSGFRVFGPLASATSVLPLVSIKPPGGVQDFELGVGFLFWAGFLIWIEYLLLVSLLAGFAIASLHVRLY